MGSLELAPTPSPLLSPYAGRLEAGAELLHRRRQIGVQLHLLLQLLAGVEHCRVRFAAEQLSHLRERTAGELAGQVDRHLASETGLSVATRADQGIFRDAEPLAHCLLDLL